MEAKDIYRQIFRLFANYDYKLMNTYIYDWESDFFAVSTSGYKIEVEVKVSRSDFFKDFEKDKHLLFADHVAKKSHHIYRHKNTSWGPESIICRWNEPRIDFQYDGKERKSHWQPLNWKRERRNGVDGYWVNDYGWEHIWHQQKEIRAESTSIDIRPIKDILCPNQLYYAAPKGLLKLEEIPAYAGLIEIDHCATIIKKAPYMHKDKQALTGILLKKFYQLWNYNLSYENQISKTLSLNQSLHHK